jgi:outer membrane protein TolC
LSLSWTLFNGFTRETNLSTALANREAAEASAADARRLVNAQVTQFLAALEAARVSFTIATASRAAADEALRVQRERYRLGAATIVDVLTAQQSLQQAEVDAVNARVNYQVAKAQLAALVGREL